MPDAQRRLTHRTPRSLPAAAPDEHEPLGVLPPGLAAALLVVIDRALDAGDLAAAHRAESLLPHTLGAEPAVVDRLVTLRLMDDDVRTARAALGAAPISTPRLDLLRVVTLLRSGDLEASIEATSGPSADDSLAIRIMGGFLRQLTLDGVGLRLAIHPAAIVCAACRRGPAGPFDGPRALQRALRGLLRLLGHDLDGTSAASTCIRGLQAAAQDLGVELPDRASGLEVTPADTEWLTRRAA